MGTSQDPTLNTTGSSASNALMEELYSPRTVTTQRGQLYTLKPLKESDLEDFYKLHSDSRVWHHLPSGRHQHIQQSEKLLQTIVTEWQTSVSNWSIRTQDGSFAGVGGLRSYLSGAVWNIYYRIGPEFWGQGLATKLAIEALGLAKRADPDRPVVAYMLENNPSSMKVAEKIGLERQWKGPDTGNPDASAIRYIYSDRPLDGAVLNELIAL